MTSPLGPLGALGPLAPPRQPWGAATTEALYGAMGFFREPVGPAGHFRTSATPGPLLDRFAPALHRLAVLVDDMLGRPEPFDLVDIGAGRGELMAAVWRLGVPARWRLHAVELASLPRPTGLPAPIGWPGRLPATVTGLIVANEWLDNVPVDVVVGTRAGPRMVLVDTEGREHLGQAPSAADQAWLDAWWPVLPGQRAEVGRPRDDAWATAVRRLARGAAVAIDYAHHRADRPTRGSLAAYRAGRSVPTVPDGRRDLTAHVALDACAAAGRVAGASSTAILRQEQALRALGVSRARPPRQLARTDPRAYADALTGAGAAAELLDPEGLGGFSWLVQVVDSPLPPPLRPLR